MNFSHKEKQIWEGVHVIVAVLKHVSLPELPIEFWWDILLRKICNDICFVYLILAGLGQIKSSSHVTLKSK
jgi:hypothetical protein